MMEGTIELRGMKFFARHGCLESERLGGNDFVVDLRYGYDMEAACASDTLEDAVDYGRIYEVVAREMAVPSNLLEHVAARIADAVKAEFPALLWVEASVSKKNPPVGGECAWSTAIIRR